MTVHLIKLCVGVSSVQELADWQEQRLKERRQAGERAELYHITRQTPKRAEELLDGGSLYWVINGWTAVRQSLVELRPVDRDGVPHCALVYTPELMSVAPHPRRPFQGWRYLTQEDAPADMGRWSREASQSASLQKELTALGLL